MKSQKFEVSVVITAFRIGPVLSDTIQSVLSQRDVKFGNIVVVVDGCSYTRTTRSTLSRFSRGYNGLVQFIWVENGGVSRARNIGARWILENRPDTDGIYYIDGDDLLNPLAITKSIKVLRDAQAKTPEKNIGWTYCNQNQFGDDTPSLEYPRNAIPNRWLSNNLSQPSCLIDRKMFDAGIYWDEDMRKGIEDWEYWLAAIEAGFIGTNVRDVYLRYRRLTGNRSSLNRANDAITKDYMRKKHQALYTTEFFLNNEHTLFPRWAFWRNHSPMSFDVGTDVNQPMVNRDYNYMRNALSYRFSVGKLDTTILEPYFPDMIAFIDPRDADVLKKLKMTPSFLLEMETLILKEGSCTFSIASTENDSNSNNDQPADIHVSKHLSTDKPLATRQFSSFFISIKRLFKLLKLNNKKLDDIQVLNSISAWSATHLELSVSGIDLPIRGEPLPGQSAGSQLNNLLVELHRIFRLPPSLSLLQRDRHNLCGSHLASHDKLGTDILGVWPILPKLKNGNFQIGLLVTEDSKYLLHDTIKDIQSVKSDSAFEINILMIGNNCDITDLVKNPEVRSIGFIDRSIDVPILEQHNGYLGLPAYELLEERTQNEILGHMVSMDVVIDLCGPRAAGVMMNLKSRGIHTSTCISKVNIQSSIDSRSEYNLMVAENTSDDNHTTDPVAIQAYSGAYKSLVIHDDKDVQRLISYGVTPSTMVTSSAELLTLLLDKMTHDVSATNAPDDIDNNDNMSAEHSIAA